MRHRQPLGQHYLQAPWVAARMVAALGLTPADLVIEVGAGRGALTTVLLQTGAQVIAVEIDRASCAHLRTLHDNLQVVQANLLACDYADLAAKTKPHATRLFLVGNLPYYLSTPLVRQWLDVAAAGIVLLVQREFAQRWTARAGDRRWGPLAIASSSRGHCAWVADVPPTCFVPPPQVESAIIHFAPHPETHAMPVAQIARLDAIAAHVFIHRRKSLRRILKMHPQIVNTYSQLDLTLRPEQMTLAQLGCLRLTAS